MKKLLFTLLVFALTPVAYGQEFYDVQEAHINNEAVEYLKNNGVIEGYSDASYKPENRINRAEFTKIIVEAQFNDEEIEACNTTNFPDVPAGQWFTKYVCVATREGLVGGYPDGTFKPANFINFAESSKIISNGLEVDPEPTGNREWFAGFVDGLSEKKAIPSTIHFFDKEITRGEMAEIIWRLKEERTDKVSQNYEDITEPFPAIQSCSALEDKFKTYRGYGHPEVLEMAVESEAAFDTAGAVANTATRTQKASDEFSETNTQVDGVDEADVIKNNGKYIYMVKGNTLRIIDAFPAEGMNEAGKIDFTKDTFYPNELILKDDILTVIGSVSGYYPSYTEGEIARILPYYGQNKTRVYLFDVSDPANIEEIRQVTYDGSYSTSRRINDELYIVLNDHPDVWIYDDAFDVKRLIPQVQDGDRDPESLVGCEDVRYFPGHNRPSYLILSSIPLEKNDNGAIEHEVFLGNSENVYVSRSNMYVATSEVNYERYTDWDWSRDNTKTAIFKFNLANGKIDYQNRGTIPGRILNQFSMDEYRNHFRIATTTGNFWSESDPAKNHVYVLDSNMKQVGSVEDIAPGEKIFSTRFVGNRLYMVTFKNIDPFFVIDLKDPKNPKILGKLKIPGFSDYLHPYDENHIIGFGKNAVDSKERDFAWYQGLKIALFDVSDVSNPKEKFVIHIGDRGSDSELLRNHKALLFDKDLSLLALPIQVNKIDDKLKTQNDGSAWGSPVFQGAYVYSLDPENGFSLRGKITHYTDEDLLKAGDYFYEFDKNIQRIIYIGDHLYTISPGVIKASDIDTTEEQEILQLEK